MIYRQFRAEKIDLSDIENAVNIITKSILENNGNSVRAPGLLDRYDEIKEIESAWLSGKKIVILQGILGIGKSSLARKAFCSLHGDNNVNVVEINFRFIPSLPELAIALSSICSIKMPFNGIDDISIQNNVKFFFEQLVQNRKLIILRDINGWLNDDGSFNKDFGIIIDTIENLHNIRSQVRICV